MADRNDFNRVDIAFVVDVTGSMGSFLSAAKANIRNMLDTFAKQRGVDIRAGLVEYQDFCDEHSSFMIRKQMLTHDLEKVHKAIANMSPGGGGDIPEAVYDGVEAAATLRWDDRSVKVAVLVGDAPPHATAAHITDPKEKASRHRAMRGDSLVDGSPSGVTLHTCTAAMEDKGITVFAIVVSGCQVTLACFEEIASFTGGSGVHGRRRVRHQADRKGPVHGAGPDGPGLADLRGDAGNRMRRRPRSLGVHRIRRASCCDLRCPACEAGLHRRRMITILFKKGQNG